MQVIGGQRSGVRGQESEVRSQESEVRSQKSEVRSQESEVRGQQAVSGEQWAVGSLQAQSRYLTRLISKLVIGWISHAVARQLAARPGAVFSASPA